MSIKSGALVNEEREDEHWWSSHLRWHAQHAQQIKRLAIFNVLLLVAVSIELALTVGRFFL